MSCRYWVTGVQLGIIKTGMKIVYIKRMIDEIIEKQSIGNYPTDKDKEQFRKRIKLLSKEKEVLE